jgi:SHS2 domain-containing protein
MEYEILEHRADLKIRAFGKTREELFSNMLKGMTDSLKPEMDDVATKRIIKISSPDLGALLVDFLNEVLYLTQANKEIYSDVDFKKLTNIELEAELLGKKTKRFGEDIKAATYHDLDVHRKDEGTWEATVLFDV